MKFGTPHRVQVQIAFLAIGAGFLIGLLYAVLMAVRALVRHSAVAVAAEDLLFCIAAAFGTFVFLLEADGGTVRGYLLLSEAAGFLAIRTAAAKIIAKLQKNTCKKKDP